MLALDLPTSQISAVQNKNNRRKAHALQEGWQTYSSKLVREFYQVTTRHWDTNHLLYLTPALSPFKYS